MVDKQMNIYDVARQIIESGEYTVAESFSLPPKLPSFEPIPQYLRNTAVGAYLEQAVASNAGLWSHQAQALEQLGRGSDVVVATGTASGKSLIFQSYAFYKLLTRDGSRVLVFYPLKALAADQIVGWKRMARDLGLSESIVGRIDGSVNTRDREMILRNSRIVIMTPDVCHAWMMSRLSLPIIKEFLKNLSLLVLDEAHTLEGVFGSSVAFLFRRLISARRELLKGRGPDTALHYVAATATISNPKLLLLKLTASEPELVDTDGAPHSEIMCAHIVAPEGEELGLAKSLQRKFLTDSNAGGFITFIDSRMSVEWLAQSSQSELSGLLGDDAVMPYRAGYSNEDRERIEKQLQSGKLRGVVTTSALELGINLPHLVAGINLGVPATRKAYRQRLGRVGRSSPGAFFIIGASDVFRRFGTTFREYHEMSVEESYLYLDNRFMQFAHARCLVDELEALGAKEALPAPKMWPTGFGGAFEAAKPGGRRATEFDAIAQLGGDIPQRGYPLRNVGEVSFRITQGEHADAFGEAGEGQALRECYPGATYLHLARAYEVVAWNTSGYSPYIKVRPTSPNRRTRPKMTTWVNASITPTELIEMHLLKGDSGFLAECQMQVTERVDGYIDHRTGDYYAYQELRQRNPNMRPRMRNFRTSGVVFCMTKPWFRKGKLKQVLADRLTEIFCREYSIIPHDVGSAATNISVRTVEGGGLRGDCIVVYDEVYGSLRLTEKLFLQFLQMLSRLEAAVEETRSIDGDTELQSAVRAIQAEISSWSPSAIEALSGTVQGAGPIHIQVFQPGSRVCIREAGAIASDVEIVQPAIMEGVLMYQVSAKPRFDSVSPVRRWVRADLLEPSADAGAWDYGWWNKETQQFEEPSEPAEAV